VFREGPLYIDKIRDDILSHFETYREIKLQLSVITLSQKSLETQTFHKKMYDNSGTSGDSRMPKTWNNLVIRLQIFLEEFFFFFMNIFSSALTWGQVEVY